MNNKIKIVIVVFFILSFLVFLNYRRKKLQENFECVKIDNSLFCPEDTNDIDKFRLDQDEYYKTEVEDKEHYRYLKNFTDNNRIVGGSYKFNYIQSSIEDEKLLEINYYKKFNKAKFNTVIRMIDGVNEFYHKYDYIDCNKEFDDSLVGGTNDSIRSIMRPGGVLFDKYTDDIIVFDAYRLRRYSYRDLRIKYNVNSDYYPILESSPIEIDTTDDFYRKELINLVFALDAIEDLNEVDFKSESYKKFTNIDEDIYIKVKYIKYNLALDENKDRKIKIKFITDKVEVEKTGDEFKSRIEFLEKSLTRSKKFKKCIEEVKNINNKEKVCRIKYQKDLPSFDMGGVEGKGVEDMQYDDDKPPTVIHSTYLDTRMSPWANSWNNIDSEGIFSPLIVSRGNRMKIFNKSGNLKFNDGLGGVDAVGNERGTIEGIKQKSMTMDPKKKTHLYNETIVNPLAGGPEKIFDAKHNNGNHNFILEDFSQQDKKKVYEATELEEPTKNKIHYGYPSIKIAKETNDSIGVYNIPDEMDSTGIGMEIVDTGKEQIILVPDVNNNRIQVFKKDKSELIYFGQFGNLNYTSERSLPNYDNKHSRYEPIHNTDDDKFISEPGCERTCKFDAQDNYSGYKRTNLHGKECKNWNDYKDEDKKIPNQQTNNELKMDILQKNGEDFLKQVREDLKNDKKLDNRCLSLPDTKEPVCVVNQKGKDTLSKCFSDYENEEKTLVQVKNKDTCDSWLGDYTDKYGPIDANSCLGDNEERQLTEEEIKSGKIGETNCIFECDARFSNRRANIHQRQTAYKQYSDGEAQVFRKRGHFYSLLDEFKRCKGGIQQEKDTGNKVFEDAEFINPHFLGVDSQACIGKKKEDGGCETKDPRNTSGVNNCSLGYRKYLLKMIAITNQGQKYGQLFHPKSIAYDSIDKKYYVVDCYHHSVQCFILNEDEKIVSASGDKLKFVSADEEFNNLNIFYYDENFKTGEADKYNRSNVHALGLRQNMIYEKDFSKFSRLGEVSDDVSEFIERETKGKADYEKIKTQTEELIKLQNQVIFDRKILRSTDDDLKKSELKMKMAKIISSMIQTGRQMKSNLGMMPLSVVAKKEKDEKIVGIDIIINEVKTILDEEITRQREKELEEERKKRVADSKEEETATYTGGHMSFDVSDDNRTYPSGAHHGVWNLSKLSSTSGYHPQRGASGDIILDLGSVQFISGIQTRGRGWDGHNQWSKKVNLYVGNTKNELVKVGSDLLTNKDRNTIVDVHLPTPVRGQFLKIQPTAWNWVAVMRVGVLVKKTVTNKVRKYKNKLIDDEGYFIDNNGNTIEGFANMSDSATAPESAQNKKFAKEKGFSVISENWANKYSDSNIKLSRWVSGISEWGNHIYADFKNNVDYKKINANGDFYFNTEKGGAGESPGCGEFSYPSDIAISSNSCLGQSVQVLMVTDTGNNRVSIFKKYNLLGNMRFRFYCFLGDEEKEDNKTLINPISVCISEVSGNVFVLESNFYDHIMNAANKTNTQRIKVFYPDVKKKNYYWSHNIEIDKKIGDGREPILEKINKEGNSSIEPRITKIRIDDRGILALTDINNNKVHLLKESVVGDFAITNIDDSALNKVTIDIDYDPYKNFKSYEDKKLIPIINNDRVRFIFQRQRVCAFQNGDVIVSKEFKTGNMPFGDYKKNFHIEDVRQEEKYDNCWIMNTDTGVKYLDSDNIINDENGDEKRFENNRPNFEINKKYQKDGSLNYYEDWRGRSLDANSSYYYKIFIYNYNFIKNTDATINKIVQTYPVYLADGDIIPKNISNDKENYISLGINYGYDSKKYNPICFTILRRIHNRTKDIVTKNINCYKGSKIQLFIPRESKIIFQIKSRPKMGRLYYYDIEKGGEFEENLRELERGVEYGENKYLIFYSCEGGDEKIGGYSLPDAKTAGVESLIDNFTFGDRLETVHNNITYNVNIDLTQNNKTPILFKDNELVEDNIKHYKKEAIGKTSTDLVKLVKMSYAKKLQDGKYVYPGIVEYCDKGINLGPDEIIPIEMNQTYEYVVLVSNPFKVNPAVNSFYYTTRPEKPYIHAVEFDKQAKFNKMSLVSKNSVEDENPNDDKVTFDGGENPEELDIANITWYYPKNRSLYWPLNFIILRKDISKKLNVIKPETYDIDFMNVIQPIESDKLFRIQKKNLKLKNNSDPTAIGIFKRRYNLGNKIDWRIKIYGTPGIEATLNDKKYDWNEPHIEFKSMKFLTLSIKLKGNQQVTNITCEETVVIEDNDTSGSPAPDPERLAQLEQHKLEVEKEENNKIKDAVEDFRKSSNVNFIFNLSDDYHGYYSNMANAPKTGFTGSLYRYIKDMEKEKLLDIFDELHNEMKIYHGDVGLRLDGENRTLRSGDKEMIIDKIRHFAFILREQKKSEYKSMGIECGELELDDIKIVSTNEGGVPKIQALECKNLGIGTAPAPSFESVSTTGISSPASSGTSISSYLTSEQCSSLEKTSLSGDDKVVITNVRTLGECCKKCQMSTECEVAEFKESDKKCELYKSYNQENEIPNIENSTLLGKTKSTFDIPPEEPIAPVESDEVIPPHLSEWEVIKTVYRKKEIIKNYSYRYSKMTTQEDRKIIQGKYAFEPTMVSLSGEPEGLSMPPISSGEDIEFSSHEASIPLPRGRRYAYKIAVFQTGLSMDTDDKKRFLGVETKNSTLGLGEVYSNEIEMGESIQQTVIINKPPFMPMPVYKVPEVERPVIKFFEPKEGDTNSIIRVVGIKLDEIEYFSFRDVKVSVLKRQERIIGNVKYQEYLLKPPSVKELERKCWQSIEKYRALLWGYWNGYQIISSEGNTDLTKMFVYNTSGECKDEKK